MKKYSPSNNPEVEEETAREIKSFYFYQMLERHIGKDWQSIDIQERFKEENIGEKYNDMVTTYYIDGVPRLRLEPAYEPNGPKLSFTLNATYL